MASITESIRFPLGRRVFSLKISEFAALTRPSFSSTNWYHHGLAFTTRQSRRGSLYFMLSCGIHVFAWSTAALTFFHVFDVHNSNLRIKISDQSSHLTTFQGRRCRVFDSPLLLAPAGHFLFTIFLTRHNGRQLATVGSG